MLPGLKPGQIVIGLRRYRYRSGDIVLAGVPEREIIKRIKKIDNKGAFLVGDNPAASHDYHLSNSDILAKVYWPRR